MTHERVCSEPASPDVWAEAPSARQNTVLVVDDGPVDRRLVSKILARETRIRATYTEHGLQALAQVESSAPDIVLTDIQMPEMDGLTLVTEIRRRFPYLPVILMTAHRSLLRRPHQSCQFAAALRPRPVPDPRLHARGAAQRGG